MFAAVIARDAGEAEFRDVARQCLAANVAPEAVTFVDSGEPSLLPPLPKAPPAAPITVPRSFAGLLGDAMCHRAADRFALLYQVLWCIAHGERQLANRVADPAIARLNDYAHNVRRDIHKMHAFVRFRERVVEGKALRRLVRAAAFYPQARCAVLRRPARESVYVTNAVKHFKFEPRGKRRIHQRPNAGEVTQCRWWLDREIAAVDPLLIVALGATAAQALAGRAIAVLRHRGPARFSGRDGFITVHPSFLLRLPNAKQKAAEYARFVDDLCAVRTLLSAPTAAA
jgi:uracil-DNA glycosylase family 4